MDTFEDTLTNEDYEQILRIFLPIHGICHYHMRLRGFGRASLVTILTRILSIVSKMTRN